MKRGGRWDLEVGGVNLNISLSPLFRLCCNEHSLSVHCRSHMLVRVCVCARVCVTGSKRRYKRVVRHRLSLALSSDQGGAAPGLRVDDLCLI
jgi:hypothetical protein